MRNKKTLFIIKFVTMLLLLIPFIVVAITKRGNFHSPWLFLGLLFLMYLDTIIVVWLLFEIKRTFSLKKTALVLAMFLLAGWIIALVTIFATKSESLIPAEHVFGGIYASLTATAIILGIYAWISNIAYKQKIHAIDNIDNAKYNIDINVALNIDIESTENTENIVDDNETESVALNAKERRKLRRQQKLHNEIITDNSADVDTVKTEQELLSDTLADEYTDIRDGEHECFAVDIESDEYSAKSIEPDVNIAEEEEGQRITSAESVDELSIKLDDNKLEAESECETEKLVDESIELNSDAIIESDESAGNLIEADISSEIASDAIVVGDTFADTDAMYSDLAIDNDDVLSDEFNRVVTAFNEESDVAIVDDYKPVKINVFENDSIIPSEIEVVKNEFVASGKFVDYSVKDETRGMYEEIENENERKIALMTDLSKVIITSNVNATIVPIEYEILERTFENKLRQSDDDAKEYYSVIKNKILSYGGVKSRVSKLADTFKCNGEVVCKITVSGKTLLVNLCLDCSKYDAKYYKFVDVGDMSKFADTPMRIKIKNKLTLKRCLEIIDKMFAEKNVFSSAIENVDYVTQYPRVENAVIFMNSIAHLIRRE